MAAKRKKKGSSKKKVTVSMDADTLRKFANAIEAISAFAGGVVKGADDVKLRNELMKRLGKKRGKKR
jgi:hypothetical protein